MVGWGWQWGSSWRMSSASCPGIIRGGWDQVGAGAWEGGVARRREPLAACSSGSRGGGRGEVKVEDDAGGEDGDEDGGVACF